MGICISFRSITLVPGDIILTGTPDGVGEFRTPKEYMQPGDVLVSEIENVGKLSVTIVQEAD